MYSKIINPAKHGNTERRPVFFNNKNSAARLGNYLNKESSSKQEKGIFFNNIVYSCETEPPIVGKVSHMWISEKR